MIRTLTPEFLDRLDCANLRLEAGRDPAPTKTALSFYCVCEPSTGEPLASVFEVDPATSVEEIEAHLWGQLLADDII